MQIWSFEKLAFAKFNVRKPLTFNCAGAPDLLLQQHDAVQQRFGRRGTARHVDVDGHDAVAAAHHRIGVVVVAAAIGAGAHRNDVARLRHLVVDLAQRRRHLVGQGAGDDHHVGLARRGARREPEPLGIVARHRHLHHLDGAAGESEGHPHQRAGARPGDQVIGRGDEEALVGEFVVDLEEEAVVRPHRLAGARIKHAGGGLRDCWLDQSHSSAPFFHS